MSSLIDFAIAWAAAAIVMYVSSIIGEFTFAESVLIGTVVLLGGQIYFVVSDIQKDLKEMKK